MWVITFKLWRLRLANLHQFKFGLYNLNPIPSHCRAPIFPPMRIANTDANCAICPRVGCNHELFCAAGHFSFVLWLLKTGRQKIHLVWKTALLLSTTAPCQQWNSLFSFCVWHPSLSLFHF